MSEAWVPVLFAAVIVIGAVGGTLAQMTLKEILPLLRTIAEQRKAGATPDLARVSAELEAVRTRLAEVEVTQQQLSEATQFLTTLLAKKTIPGGGAADDESEVRAGPAAPSSDQLGGASRSGLDRD